jgi:hypothetical protein
MPSRRRIRINTRPAAAHYVSADERIVEYSSPSGGGLISFREVAGRLVVDLYLHDSTVEIRAGAASDV